MQSKNQVIYELEGFQALALHSVFYPVSPVAYHSQRPARHIDLGTRHRRTRHCHLLLFLQEVKQPS